MRTCCCSLAGTSACITCSNNNNVVYQTWSPYVPMQPAQPLLPIPKLNEGWKCLECGQVWGLLIGKCDCNKKEK